MEKMNISKKLSFSVQISKDSTKYIHGDTIDELIEAIEELRDVKFIRKFIKEFPNLSKEQYERLENAVLNSNDIDEIYKYVMDRKESLINIENFEDTLIELGDNSVLIAFAINIKGANIGKLEEAVIRSKNKIDIANFFSYIEASNLEKIKEALWTGEKNAIAICEFIRVKKERGYNIELDEIKEAEDTIIAYNDARLCVEWAEINIEGINISKLEDIVIQDKYGNYIYEFAKCVEGANIEKLEDAIIKTGDASAIYHFAREVEGVNLYKLRKALKATKDRYYMNRWIDTFGAKGLFKNNW